MRMIGAITIGQAPRDDVVSEMEKLLGAGVRVLQAGALDGLSRAHIAALGPALGDDALITRLTDGSEVIVAKRASLFRDRRVRAHRTRRGGTLGVKDLQEALRDHFGRPDSVWRVRQRPGSPRCWR